jgi:hypothetical protein
MNVTMIVVKHAGNLHYTCATKAGVLKNNIHRSYITACPNFDVASHDLDGVPSLKYSSHVHTPMHMCCRESLSKCTGCCMNDFIARG